MTALNCNQSKPDFSISKALEGNRQEVRASQRKQGFSGRAAAAAKLLINVCNLLIALLNCHGVLANPIVCQCSCLLPLPPRVRACEWGGTSGTCSDPRAAAALEKMILTSAYLNLPYSKGSSPISYIYEPYLHLVFLLQQVPPPRLRHWTFFY